VQRLTVTGALLRLAFRTVLLLKDAQVRIDTVQRHRLATQQLVQVLPFGLQPLVTALARSYYRDESVYDLQTALHRFNINQDKTKGATLYNFEC
jgi:hypothetical protein